MSRWRPHWPGIILAVEFLHGPKHIPSLELGRFAGSAKNIHSNLLIALTLFLRYTARKEATPVRPELPEMIPDWGRLQSITRLRVYFSNVMPRFPPRLLVFTRWSSFDSDWRENMKKHGLGFRFSHNRSVDRLTWYFLLKGGHTVPYSNNVLSLTFNISDLQELIVYELKRGRLNLLGVMTLRASPSHVANFYLGLPKRITLD